MVIVKVTAAAICLIASLTACRNGFQNTYQGYIEGDYLYISSSVGGKVVKKHVDRGDWVDKDTLLFELDPEPERSQYLEAQSRFLAAEALFEDKTRGQRPPELAAIEASIDRAESALSFSRKELARVKTLRDREAIAVEKYDAAEAAYERDAAAVAELKERLKVAKLGARSGQLEAARKDMERSKTALDRASWSLEQKKGTAPGQAFVTDVLYHEGEYVPPGYPVAVLLPPDRVKARFFVPEEKLSSLERGQKVSVSLDGSTGSIEGTVRYISPQAEYTPPFIYSKDNRKKLVFMVEVSFRKSDARNLHPGQPVEVRIGP